MSSLYVIFGAISLMFGGVVYVAISDYIFAIGTCVVSLLYFYILAIPKIIKSVNINNRYHECYRFINNFIISLNVRGSLIQSFDSVSNQMSKQYLDTIESIKNQSEIEKIHYLERYFNFHIYSIFTTILEMWLEEGGDVLSHSRSLLEEAKNNENVITNNERIFKRKIVEFITLWAFSLAIVVVLRFALAQFYDKVSSQLFFKICVVSFFLIILVSIEFLIRRGTESYLKGGNK